MASRDSSHRCFVIAKPSSKQMTTGAAGRALSVTSRRVQQLIASGRLPAERIGDRLVVPTDAVDVESGRRDAAKADREHERGAAAAAKADGAFARAASAEGRDPNDPRYRQMGKPARTLCTGRGGSR
jgi:excisionase family DNA binding protein